MSEIINGRETLDQTPVSYPLHFQRPEPLHLRIRRMILEQMQLSEEDLQNDSFDEADDFSIDDDDDMPASKYEMEDDFDHLYDTKWKGGAGGETSPAKEAESNQGVPPADGETSKEGN